MAMECTICHDGVDLKNMSVVKCGHIFHDECLKGFIKKNKKKCMLKCPGSECKTKLNNEKIVQTCQSDDEEMDKINVQGDNSNTQVICIICNEILTDSNAMAVTECGHLFGYNCIVEYVKPKAKKYKCPVESCGKIVTAASIIRIIPNDMDVQNDDQHCDKLSTGAKNVESWEAVAMLIQKSFKDRPTISYEESLNLKKNIVNLLNTLNQDAKSDGLKVSFNNDQRTEYCKRCEKYENKIDNLEKKLLKMRDTNHEYRIEIKKFKAREAVWEKDEREASDSSVHLRDENAQKNVEINELTEKKKELEEMIQNLESQLTSVTAELGRANSSLSEIKAENETLQQDLKTLQSQVITIRDENIGLQTELQDLQTENGNLSTRNKQMEIDLRTLKEDFDAHESAITDFMMSELQTNLQHDAVQHNLTQQLDTLQQANDTLRRYNEDLRTENEYRWQLITNIRASASRPENVPDSR